MRVLESIWPWLLLAASIGVAVVAAGHAITNKRDVRAAVGWTGLILLSPFLGALLYYFLGINRIQRRAARITSDKEERDAGDGQPRALSPEEVGQRYGKQLGTLSSMVGTVTEGLPLYAGNAVELLTNGDEAYPEMLLAIRSAERSVALQTYIFDHDRAGRMFVDALRDATERGVEVRVLIDSVGARYSRPRTPRVLRRAGIRTAEFIKTRNPLRNPYMNLRSHRKMLVVDGRIGFVGGMNIREGCLLEEPSEHPVQDVHFRLEGPVVEQILSEFARDWLFTTGEELKGQPWEVERAAAGPVAARGIADGPDEDLDRLVRVILSALDVARESVRISTPYFLPERDLIAALELTVLRGVRVDILLPEKGNLRFVQWASFAQLWQVIQPGCRVWLTPEPFDHSKFMVVDGAWSLIGSSNWDPRSLRLNFEYNVECYDESLARRMLGLTDEKLARSRLLTLEEVDGRPLATRLRDGVARLFLPYL
jgi:cardiolipin synthase